jgi:hypothetical protein
MVPGQTVGEFVDGPRSRLSNLAESEEMPHRSTLLAEPFPGAVAQGGVLMFAKEFSGL